MLELLLCSMLTILPDYLFRRYAQGKRLGKEITFYSVWFELRWGITGCLILTVALITVIFYNHPSTRNVTLFFRTVPIVPEINGRVAEVYVGVSSPISKGAPIFRLDSSKQEAAAESARRKIAETDAEMLVARADILKTEGQIQEAKSAHSRRWTNSRPSENSNDAIRATSHSATSRNLRSIWRVARVPLPPLLLLNSKPRSGSLPFCRLRKPVPKRRWNRPRWNYRRRLFMPA